MNPVVIGDNPEIPTEVFNQEGVPMQFDFRSIYGSILMDWFDLLESDVQDILNGDFSYMPVLLDCNSSGIKEESFTKKIEIHNYPNPFTSTTNIVFETEAEKAKVSVFDHRGAEIKVLADRHFSSGEHTIVFDSIGLPSGNYYVRIITKDRQNTSGMVKIK